VRAPIPLLVGRGVAQPVVRLRSITFARRTGLPPPALRRHVRQAAEDEIDAQSACSAAAAAGRPTPRQREDVAQLLPAELSDVSQAMRACGWRCSSLSSSSRCSPSRR